MLYKSHFSFLFLFTFLAFFISNTTITDPVAVLDHPEITGSSSGNMTVKEFRASTGVTFDLGYQIGENTQFEIIQFYMTRVPKGASNIVEIVNRKSTYNARAFELLQQASSGDTYYFDKILAKRKGVAEEEEPLKLNSMFFRIQ